MPTVEKKLKTIKRFGPGIVSDQVKSHANDPFVVKKVEPVVGVITAPLFVSFVILYSACGRCYHHRCSACGRCYHCTTVRNPKLRSDPIKAFITYLTR